MFHWFKKKENKEVPEDKPTYCIESSLNNKFKVCLDLTNKTLVCYMPFSNDDLLKEYKHIVNNNANAKLLVSIRMAMVASMKEAVDNKLGYMDNSVTRNDDGIRVFLEPDSFVDIEAHIIAVAKIVKEKLDIMVNNVSALNDTIEHQLEIGRELEAFKSMYLTKAIEEANNANWG